MPILVQKSNRSNIWNTFLQPIDNANTFQLQVSKKVIFLKHSQNTSAEYCNYCVCVDTHIRILCKSVCHDITVRELCRSRPYSVWLTKRHWEWTVMPVIALLNNLKVWKTNTCDLKSTSFVFCYVLQFIAYYRTSLRGANKVLQLPTLIKKMVKINCWVMMSMYQLVINFRKMMKNDVPFTCTTSSWRHCKYKYFF